MKKLNAKRKLFVTFSGSRSGALGTPIVYTRVADFVPWIQSKLTDQCMCSPKTGTKNDSLDKLPTEKKPTDVYLQPAKNSSGECGNIL